MCGIVGYIGERVGEVERAVSLTSHRGPDNTGVISEQFRNKIVELGHNRLSIIDLSSAGNQPMLNEDKSIVLAFNGEVYNFKKLQLKYLQDIECVSKSDTEVVLRMYERFGNEFLAYLEGDFALSIFDKRKGKVVLCRDRCGVKPMYFSTQNNEFVFGSEIKSILAITGYRKVEEDELNNFFVFKYSPANKTLFKNVFRVKPGHYIEVDVESLNISESRYWEPQSQVNNEDLYSLLEKSVQDRLIADVPIGNFLSGGVDSSIIASFLKDRKDITHYCAVKDERDIKIEGTTSDQSFARDLASSWNLNFKEIPIGSDETNEELITKTIWYGDDLIADGSQIPSYLITQQASKTSKVLLSGMGADELFFGYAGHQLILLDQYLHKLPGFLQKSICEIWGNLNPGKGSFKAYKRYLHKIGRLGHLPDYRNGMYSIVGDATIANSITNFSDEATIDYISSYFMDNDPFEAIQKFEFDNFLAKNLSYMDRMSMANSVEVRVPFLDHRLIEFAFGIKREEKLSNTFRTKHILKETFKNILPSEILNRRKAGFGMPLRSIFSSEQKIYSLLDLEFFGSFSYFNIENIKRMIVSHTNGVEDNSPLIYALISYEKWYKQFIAQ